MTQTISAAANPAMVNNMIQKVMEELPQPKEEVQITPPSDTIVTLPGGYITSAGEVITEAEVRELDGNDEEAIAKASNVGRAVLTILQRGTVRIGNQKADEKLLDQLLSKAQVRKLGLLDRRTIINEINKRVPGPQFDDITVTDPDTGKEVQVPINFGSLFQF